jgi:hypothetical protein
MYHGNIDDDLERLNASTPRSRSTFGHVTICEWVRFWGLILAARQFNHKGKDLWVDHTSTDGVHEAPCF